MRRGWLALCIGVGIAIVIYGIGAAGWSRPIANGRDIVYPPLFYVGFPGFALQMIFQWFAPGALHINAFAIVMQILKVVGNLAFYSLAAYLALRLLARRKSSDGSVQYESANGVHHARLTTRRLWLALGIGVGVVGLAAAVDYIPITRQIPNGHEVTTFSQLHPSLMNLDLPGLLLMMFMLMLTPVHWGDHPVAARLLVAGGNAMFYCLAVYLVLWLTARWKRQ
jgi:hypothetical protein